jgi:AraC-like DNA-binding protein
VGYALDVELYPAAELLRRAGDVDARGFERIDFHSLLYVAAGRYSHTVDFETLSFEAGSLLLLKPGQVHRFGNLAGWDGWLMVFRSELLPAATSAGSNAGRAGGEFDFMHRMQALPTRLVLSAAARPAVTEAVKRMADDSKLAAGATVNLLLRSQLLALLIRLQLDCTPPAVDRLTEPALLKRFTRYHAAVEQEFARWHSVDQYAKHLGCSVKSLTRAALVLTDRSAKAVLIDRIVLEAKRLLAHTYLPVAAVSDRLGFGEATNFVKFFRRETGLTPGAFRSRLTRTESSRAGLSTAKDR